MDKKMKDYLVKHKLYRDIIYIVSAEGAKEAINEVYSLVCDTIYKEDLTARSIASLHSANGNIIDLTKIIKKGIK